MNTRTAAKMLDIARTDVTFARCEIRGRPGWSGKCLHCRTRLLLEEDGTPISRVTIEHIVPRNKGGTDELKNLALACARCNHGKGVRIDGLSEQDERYQRVVGRLLEERLKRWREPDDGLG